MTDYFQIDNFIVNKLFVVALKTLFLYSIKIIYEIRTYMKLFSVQKKHQKPNKQTKKKKTNAQNNIDTNFFMCKKIWI